MSVFTSSCKEKAVQNYALEERFVKGAERNGIFKENLKVVSVGPKFQRDLGESGKFRGAGFGSSQSKEGRNGA